MRKKSLILVLVLLLLSLSLMFVACNSRSPKFEMCVAMYEVIPDDLGDLETRVDNTVSHINDLLVSKGYTGTSVTKDTNSFGNITIRVEVPDVEDPDRVLKLIGSPATLEFKKVDSVSAEALIVGREHLESAYVTTDGDSNYAIGLKFNEAGTKKFADITSEYLNKSIYIYIDGERYTTVNVNSQILDGKAIITRSGGYTYQEASDLAMRLQFGAVGVSLRHIEAH